MQDPFVHLHVHSPYSFLDGASDLESLVKIAAGHGMPALALTDHNSVSAVVKFTRLCEGYGIKPIMGSELTMEDGTHLTLLARNRAGYTNLCRLLTLAYSQGGRLTPRLAWAELEPRTAGLFCLSGCRKSAIAFAVLSRRYEEAFEIAARLLAWFGKEHFYIELQDDFTPDCMRVCRDLTSLAAELGVGAVATNNVHYVTRRGLPLHDVLRCISAGITLGDEAHECRPLNFERWLKPGGRMKDFFFWNPAALAASVHIAEQCEPVLPEGGNITPPFLTPNGSDSGSYLRYLVTKGAKARYRVLTPALTARLEHELTVLCELGYADYVLLAWKVARWARSQNLRCTGRGSAADSAVCYSLMLTDVDVMARNLPFARFLVPGKIPDIDLDFDAARRDEVFEYIKREWGEDKVAMACTFFTYHAKGALRDVGKVLGLPEETLRFFSEHFSGFIRADRIEEAFDTHAELKPHKHLSSRFQLLFELCSRIAGFPRHLGTHSSGVVISRIPLTEIAPVLPTARGVMPAITLDKDDVEEVGAVKLDVLALRILSAVQDTEDSIRRSDAGFRYDQIPHDDAPTFAWIRSGRAMGAFQLESPAQMALAATLYPEHFEDLVASVALIRPGPIRSHAVKRFVACRNGWAKVDMLHPCLAPILAKTYGCVVFQEQVVQVIAAMIGCSDAEADRVRKRLAKHDRAGTMHEAQEEFISRARAVHPDLSAERAQLIWQQVETWSGYGFTEGHAASFALTASRSAYLSVHYPAAYFAGMMSNMPMGYYNANTLAAEARHRGVTILPVEINASEADCTGEEQSLRLGFCLVADLRDEDSSAIVQERERNGPFHSLLEFCVRVPLHLNRIENLVLCGAFDRLHSTRRGLLWRLQETLALAQTLRAHNTESGQQQMDMGTASSLATPVAEGIDDFTDWEAVKWAWRITGVTAEAHVMARLRERLAKRQILTTTEVTAARPGARITTAGLNICPHRPPTRSGRPVLFTSIEDEAGFLQATCFGEALDTCTPVFLLSPAVIVQGIVERKGSGVSVRVERAKPLTMDWQATLSRASGPYAGRRH